MTNSKKWFTGFVCLAVLALAAASFAADAAKSDAPAKTKHAAHAMAKPVQWPADKLTWIDNPGAAGVKLAVLWGDPAKGPHASLHKFPAGFKAPLHTHSSDLRCVVIAGTIIHGEADGTETRLGPGSYYFNPHTEKHTTACDAASECEMFVESSGKFDLKLVGEKPMEKKAAK
ncbi:MAG: cupin domain-containing protein [Thermoanaerobaculia bacterium]